MSLIYKGTVIDQLNYKGTDVTSVIYKGTTIATKTGFINGVNYTAIGNPRVGWDYYVKFSGRIKITAGATSTQLLCGAIAGATSSAVALGSYSAMITAIDNASYGGWCFGLTTNGTIRMYFKQSGYSSRDIDAEQSLGLTYDELVKAGVLDLIVERTAANRWQVTVGNVTLTFATSGYLYMGLGTGRWYMGDENIFFTGTIGIGLGTSQATTASYSYTAQIPTYAGGTPNYFTTNAQGYTTTQHLW